MNDQRGKEPSGFFRFVDINRPLVEGNEVMSSLCRPSILSFTYHPNCPAPNNLNFHLFPLLSFHFAEENPGASIEEIFMILAKAWKSKDDKEKAMYASELATKEMLKQNLES